MLGKLIQPGQRDQREEARANRPMDSWAGLIQIKQSDETRAQPLPMARIDLLELIGILIALVTFGTLCTVYFSIE